MIKAIRGTKDILPGDAPRWQALEASARGVFRLYGYEEIRTPVIEETVLFVKTVGEDTDIVKKEMFSFRDRGERDITLRPEGTAPIMRAYIEHGLDRVSSLQKLCYVGPMFRAERPQAGRLRQFTQIGLEAIGSKHPAVDAEAIRVMVAVLDAAGIVGYEIRLNNLGCRDDKKKLSAMLTQLFSGEKVSPLLCEDCVRRARTNPLRVLDCKSESCRTVVRALFRDVKFLCDDCVKHFDAVSAYLALLGVPFTVDPFIVRGLDYYTKTVFEVTHGALGSQDAIGAGGRYDNLSSDMGGPDAGACGFALGVERMLLVLDVLKPPAPVCERVAVFIAAIGDEAHRAAFPIADRFRAAGVACEIDLEGRSLKAQMRAADRVNARYVAIIGGDELAKQEATVRDMDTKEQISVNFENLVTVIKSKIG